MYVFIIWSKDKTTNLNDQFCFRVAALLNITVQGGAIAFTTAFVLCRTFFRSHSMAHKVSSCLRAPFDFSQQIWEFVGIVNVFVGFECVCVCVCYSWQEVRKCCSVCTSC